MIGKVLNKEIATCFWVGRDSDGKCHIFNEEPYLLGKGDFVVWKAVEDTPAWDVIDSDLFSCVQPGCLYKASMNFKLKNCEDEKLLFLM